ncbi:MAG TPA: hypothetical protein VIO32_10345 [Candidatus Baltobacteraceae bacterium]
MRFPRRLPCVAALVALAACAGPVQATRCSFERVGPHRHNLVMIASITNNTAKPLHHVGVLQGPMEFEFNVKLGPHGIAKHAVGTPYIGDYDRAYPGYDWAHVSPGCWARFVDFDDGTNWSVSPL